MLGNGFYSRKHGLLSLVRGRRCQVCGVVRDLGGDDLLCPSCIRELGFRSGGFCPGCGKIYALENVFPYPCLECQKNPPVWSALGFYASYQGLLRELILDFKFRGDLGLGQILGDLLVRAYKGHALFRPDLLVPVPAHETRLKERGFNQSLELARILGSKSGIKVDFRALTKDVLTQPQTTLEGRERLQALKNTFSADPGRVESRSIMLVDDIFTTGSTLKECTKTLHGAGAYEVQVLFLARNV